MKAGTLEIELLANIARLQKDMDTAKRTVSGAMDQVERAVNRARNALGLLGGAFAVRELSNTVDAYTKFTAQLKLATASAQAYAKAYADVRSISMAAQADLGAVGTLYARIANGTRELGLGQQKLAAITETVSLALKVSGATGAEAASAMLQLSQAFGSGVLRGEEFNAVNEAAPRLMRALADGIGVGVGALRGMAEAGQLTSQVLAEALPKALGELREEAKSVQTIAGSVQLLKNNWLEFVGTQAQASGAVGAVSQSIALLANNLDLLTAAALGYGATRLSQLLFDVGAATGRAVASTMEYAASQQAQRASAIAAAQAEAQKTAATLANLQATQAGIVAAREQYIAELQLINAFKARGLAMQQASAVTAELALLGQQQARVSAQIAATQAAQTAAQTALNTAMTAGGAAAGLASRALGLLGGPIGVITTLLGLGATAWMLWGTKAQESAQKAGDALRDTLADGIAVAQSQLPALNRQIQESLDAGYAADSSRVQALMRRRDALQAEIDSARKQRQQIADQQAKEEAISRHEYARRVDLNKLAAQHAARGSEYMKRYATDAEKLTAALEEARIAFGGVLPPDAEARIRASFIKPVRDIPPAIKQATEAMESHVKAWEAYTEYLAGDAAAVSLRQIKHFDELENAANEQLKYAADMLASIEAETLALTMTNAQREEAIALRQLELQGIKAGTPVYEAYAEKIREAIANKGMVQANLDATRHAQEEWQRTSDQIGQSLSDALMEGGKSAWEYIKGLFRSQVLAPIIKAVIAPVTGGLASLITGGAQAATGASGGLGGGTGLFGGLTSFSGWGTGIAGSLGNLGAGFGIGASGGLFGGGLSTGISLMQSGATMGGLGAIAGAVMPWVAAIGAISSLFGNRNKWSGQFGETLVSGGMAGDTASRSTFTNSTYSAEVARATQAVGEGIAGAIATFGGAQQDLVLRQFSATASKKDRAQAGTDLFIGGEFVSIGNTEVKKGEQGQAFADQALRATVVALQKTVEGRFGEYFDSVDALKADIPDLQALLDTATAVQQLGKQLQWLGGPFDDLVNLSVQATADLATAAGGFDNLLSITSNAYQVLYSEEERLAFLREDVAVGFAKLGVAMPETTEQLRDYIEGLDTSTEAGRTLLLELLKLAPALDQVASKVEDVTQTASASAGWAGRYGLGARAGLTPAELDTRTESQDYWEYAAAAGMDPHSLQALQAWRYQSRPDPRQDAARVVQSFMDAQPGGMSRQVDLLRQQSDEIMASIEAYRSLNDRLKEFKNSLQLGSMSTLTPQQQYELARAEFERVSGMAAAGDTTAQGMLQGVISTFLEESRSYFGANDAYVADMDRSVGIIDQVVAQRESLEEKSVKLLESVDKKLADLIDVTTRNGSVQEAGFVESVKATRDAVEKQLQASKSERAANA